MGAYFITEEFEITATGPNMEPRVWTRSTLLTSRVIADGAVQRLGYTKAVVTNTYGGVNSDPLYVAIREQAHEQETTT